MISINETHYVGNNRLTLGIVLGVITFWLFAQSLSGIAPQVTQSVGMTSDSFNLALSLTALFSGCFIVVAGGLADKIGRVKITNIGFILSIVGSLTLILATNASVFSLGRIIQGLSAACIMPSTLALMKTYYDGKERQRALSYWSFGSWGGSGICLLAGGAIATYLGWHWIFIFSIICAVLGLFLIRGTPESKSEEHSNTKFDYASLFFFVVSLMTLNILITKGSALGWSSSLVLIIGAIFLLSTIIFFKLELIKKEGCFIDFLIFKNKAYSGATLSNFMLNAVGGTLPVASSYLQDGRHFTSFSSGVLTIGYLVAVLGTIRVGEKILQKVGAKKPMILGTLTNAVGIGLMTLTFLPHYSYNIAVFVGYIFFGLGLGMYATPSTDTAVNNVPANKAGIASGIYKMASSLGGAFGIAISMAVYTAFKTNYGFNIATTIALFVNVIFCILSFISIILMVPKNTGKEE